MITQADTKRMAYAMDSILRDDDAQYLIDEAAKELTRKRVVCDRCGVVIEDATVQTKKCRPCAIKHSKEQAAKKKAAIKPRNAEA